MSACANSDMAAMKSSSASSDRRRCFYVFEANSFFQMPLIIHQQPGRAFAFGIMSMPVLGEMAKMKALAYAGKSPAER
jgi:hypothetical protein